VKTLVASVVVACAVAVVPSRSSAQPVFAQSGFNDQAGINSDPAPNSPFTIGQTAGGRGAGEPGWAEPWLGGGTAGDLGAIVRSASAYEGDGGLELTKGTVDNVVASRRLLPGITGRFATETRVNFAAVGELYGVALQNNYPFRVDRNGPMWRITGPVDQRHFEVFDGQSNQLGDWEDTGIGQRPGVWQNVVVDADVVTQRFTFSVDGVPYNAPDPLGFNDAASEITGVAYLSTGSGSIDAVTVRAVPEPAAVAFALMTLSALLRRPPAADRLRFGRVQPDLPGAAPPGPICHGPARAPAPSAGPPLVRGRIRLSKSTPPANRRQHAIPAIILTHLAPGVKPKIRGSRVKCGRVKL
jgi:hypothetical protein